jgi:hypothetical protein
LRNSRIAGRSGGRFDRERIGKSGKYLILSIFFPRVFAISLAYIFKDFSMGLRTVKHHVLTKTDTFRADTFLKVS